jgi:hypothetical protein
VVIVVWVSANAITVNVLVTLGIPNAAINVVIQVKNAAALNAYLQNLTVATLPIASIVTTEMKNAADLVTALTLQKWTVAGCLQTSSAVTEHLYNAAVISVYLRDIVVGPTARGMGVQNVINAAALVKSGPYVFVRMTNVAAMGWTPRTRFTAARKIANAAATPVYL